MWLTLSRAPRSEIEAAVAYDREAVRQRGLDAITNFELNEYVPCCNPSATHRRDLHRCPRYADVLAECLPGNMQVSASISAAIRASATASARSSGAMGPAVTVEPSPEAIGAVQAVFALAPQLLADSELEGGASLAPFTSASHAFAAAAAAATAGPAHHAPAPAKRQRLTLAAARAEQLVLQEAAMQRAASAQATAVMQQQFGSMVEVVMQPAEPAMTDVCGHKPQTPQQMVPRRTSAPY